MPEKHSNKVWSISSVDTQIPSMSSSDAEHECLMARLVEICGGKLGVYSPIIAIDRVTLPSSTDYRIQLRSDCQLACKNDDGLAMDPQCVGDEFYLHETSSL